MMEPDDPLQSETIERQADEVVDKFPDATLESLAGDLEADAAEHKETAATARALAVELRTRAFAGVRKWPVNS